MLTLNNSTANENSIQYANSGGNAWSVGLNVASVGASSFAWYGNGNIRMKLDTASKLYIASLQLSSFASSILNTDSSGNLISTNTQVTLTGTTSGTAVCSQPSQASSYKKVIVYFSNFQSTTQTYTFPTPFTNTAPTLITSASGLSTNWTTKLVFSPSSPGSAINGYQIYEGY